MIMLDTHVVIWIYENPVKLITPFLRDLINQNDIFISPMVELEIEYLYEINRIKINADKILVYLNREIGLNILYENDWKFIFQLSKKLKWTRDPFDRLIVAHAAIDSTQLITKDEKIHQYYKQSLWK